MGVNLNESQTRALLVNPLLANADWKLSDRSQIGFEIPVSGYDPQPWNGITDYCLYHASGPVLGIVEAKRTSRSPREGEEQNNANGSL
jgi:type I site-specific restriction endonuclease